MDLCQLFIRIVFISGLPSRVADYLPDLAFAINFKVWYNPSTFKQSSFILGYVFAISMELFRCDSSELLRQNPANSAVIMLSPASKNNRGPARLTTVSFTNRDQFLNRIAVFTFHSADTLLAPDSGPNQDLLRSNLVVHKRKIILDFDRLKK